MQNGAVVLIITLTKIAETDTPGRVTPDCVFAHRLRLLGKTSETEPCRGRDGEPVAGAALVLPVYRGNLRRYTELIAKKQ
jgi:hypothetical protein